MEDTRKRYLIYLAISVLSFSCGVVFSEYVLSKYLSKETEEVKPSIVSEKDIQNIPIEISNPCSIRVDISGAVKTPGVYCMDNGSLIVDAVKKAGGFSKEYAFQFVSRRINLSQQIVNNQKIYIPTISELDCKIVSFSQEIQKLGQALTDSRNSKIDADFEQNITDGKDSSNQSTNTNQQGQCVNINTATKEQLMQVSGIGEVTATKIIEKRPYQKIEDLLNVSGIGEATLNKIKSSICI